MGYTDDPVTVNTSELPKGVTTVPGMIVSATVWSSSPFTVPGVGNQRAVPVGRGNPTGAASVGAMDVSVADRQACAAGT
jgi:hypothetical protein